MKFAIIGNKHQRSKSEHAGTLIKLLEKHGAQICIEKKFHKFLEENLHIYHQGTDIFEGTDFSADMVISLGGDGTFLKAASYVGDKDIPIIGINTGRLGFLADVSPEDIESTFDEICKGNYKIEERSVIHVETEGHDLETYPYALNEIAVLKHDSSSMLTITTYINGNLLNTYQADGLILSTPTGSTAYSLSAGGPIIAPHSKTIAITPIAPHSLNCRPFVICDDWDITLEVESRSHNFLIAVDGRSESCGENTKIRISRANYSVKVVKCFGHTFFDTLRQKMMWGADAR